MARRPDERKTGDELGPITGLPLDLEQQIVAALADKPRLTNHQLAETLRTDLEVIETAIDRITARYNRRLTPRQKFILEEVATGRHVIDIGFELGMTPDQVQGHVTRAHEALGHNRRDASVIHWLVTSRP